MANPFLLYIILFPLASIFTLKISIKIHNIIHKIGKTSHPVSNVNNNWNTPFPTYPA